MYFNDDMFLTAPVTKEMFFKNDLPRDTFALNVICYGKDTAGLFNTNDMMVEVAVIKTAKPSPWHQQRSSQNIFHPVLWMKPFFPIFFLLYYLDVTPAIEAIRGQNYKMVCLNDTGATTEWENI